MAACTGNTEVVKRDKHVKLSYGLVNGREETPEKERALPEARVRKYKKTGQKWNDFKIKPFTGT